MDLLRWMYVGGWEIGGIEKIFVIFVILFYFISSSSSFTP